MSLRGVPTSSSGHSQFRQICNTQRETAQTSTAGALTTVAKWAFEQLTQHTGSSSKRLGWRIYVYLGWASGSENLAEGEYLVVARTWKSVPCAADLRRRAAENSDLVKCPNRPEHRYSTSSGSGLGTTYMSKRLGLGGHHRNLDRTGANLGKTELEEFHVKDI